LAKEFGESEASIPTAGPTMKSFISTTGYSSTSEFPNLWSQSHCQVTPWFKYCNASNPAPAVTVEGIFFCMSITNNQVWWSG